MQKSHNFQLKNDSLDIRKIVDLLLSHYKLFLFSLLFSLLFAFFINRYMIPVYRISSSMLIKEETRPTPSVNVNDYLNSSLLGGNQNFQNELWVLRSSPVLEQTIRNLDLNINYNIKKNFKYQDAYESVPFKILIDDNHFQPINIRFKLIVTSGNSYLLEGKAKTATFSKFNTDENFYVKDDWSFKITGSFGELIQTEDLSFIIQLDTLKNIAIDDEYYFSFSNISSLVNYYKVKLEFTIIQQDATVIEIGMKSPSLNKGKDIINELMDVYSQQNLDRKNHIANITIDYIEKQLGEISDSLSQTEDNLQNFRSSKQLLNISEQATGASAQYRELQNRLAELTTLKRYYDYVAEYLSENEDFSDMIVPASMGIQDQLLNSLMSELMSAQAQRSALIQNRQERNPLVQRLSIQIENIKKTIIENISAVRKTTDISIDEMNKRIVKIESEISRIPKTQRQLGGIERKYRLNDAIYNYLLEKRAEAKITQASNLPDNLIIEPAGMVGFGPIAPNKKLNYLIAIFIGITIPFASLMVKNALNNRIESQDDIEKITNIPVLGKIMHNIYKSNNIVFEHPRSSISESYRALRTNLDFQFKNKLYKVILVTSCIEGEGKSFNALNLAMSYAQLEKKTIVLDFDLRKDSSYFGKEKSDNDGISSYFIDKVSIEDIILKSSNAWLDYISSGPIPPNPMELLTLNKTSQLIDVLKDSYDYIILDSTPIAQVSDAYLLMNYSDVNIIVTRCNYTIKKVFSLIMKDLNHKNINNLCLILNDNKVVTDQYGYGYGYNKKKIKG